MSALETASPLHNRQHARILQNNVNSSALSIESPQYKGMVWKKRVKARRKLRSIIQWQLSLSLSLRFITPSANIDPSDLSRRRVRASRPKCLENRGSKKKRKGGRRARSSDAYFERGEHALQFNVGRGARVRLRCCVCAPLCRSRILFSPTQSSSVIYDSSLNRRARVLQTAVRDIEMCRVDIFDCMYLYMTAVHHVLRWKRIGYGFPISRPIYRSMQSVFQCTRWKERLMPPYIYESALWAIDYGFSRMTFVVY